MSVINGNSSELLIVKNGLLFYIDAANRKSYISGSNTLYDLSGNNHTGSLINGVGFDSTNGGSLTFDASDDYVNISSSLSSIVLTDTPGFTITGWFNTSVVDNNWRTVISKQLGTARQFYIGLNGGYGGTTNALSFFTNQGGQGGVSTTSALQINTWYYFAATHYGTDGATGNTLYVRSSNGIEPTGSAFDPSTSAMNTDVGTAPINIGKYTTDVPFLWNGKISAITFYNRKLSQSEILQNYNSNKSRYATSITAYSSFPKVPLDGLVFDLDAANAKSYVSGSSTIYDLVGTKNGTLTNGPIYNTGSKGSISFDGVDDYIQISGNTFGYSPGATGEISLEAWVYPTGPFSSYIESTITNLGGIFGEGYFSGTTGWGLGVVIRSDIGNSFVFQTRNGGTIVDAGNNSSSTFTTNSWYHIVGTFTRNDLSRLYINGNLVTSTSSTSLNGVSLTPATNNAEIGRSSAIGPFQFGGRISTAKIYNRPLTANEVRNIYNYTKGRYNL